MMRKIDVECTFILHYHSIILFNIRYKELYFLVKTFDQIMLKGPTCTHDLSSKSLSLFFRGGQYY